MEQSFFYILYSTLIDKYYLGSTSNLKERIIRYNQKSKGFTSRTKDWKLVYYEVFSTKIEAYARERKVKKWKNRTRVEQLIAQKTQL